jgi:hypothetical protein
MSNVRRSGWVIRGGTADDGWDMHLAFVLGSLLAVPGFAALLIVAARTSGLAQLGAVIGAVALALLMVWTAALFAIVLALARRLRSRP